MAKVQFSECDKLTYKILRDYGCQSSKQIRTCMVRFGYEPFSTGSIGASLRKMAQKGIAASSENEHGQKVYWLTEYGIKVIKEENNGK